MKIYRKGHETTINFRVSPARQENNVIGPNQPRMTVLAKANSNLPESISFKLFIHAVI
jgi:hypothetical protein